MNTQGRYNLDFTLELTHGALHNLGDALLIYRVWASTFLPTGESPKALIVVRNRDWSLAARELRLTQTAADLLVEILQALGLPERTPRVTASAGNISGWQRLRLSASLTGVEWNFTLDLQYGGATGEDAQALRELIEHLIEIAELTGEKDRLLVI